MKNLVLITCLIFSFTFFNCCSTNSTDIADSNAVYTMAVNESKILKLESKDIILLLKSIADSRCPIGAQCIWAGEVLVEIDISYDNGSIPVRLCGNKKCIGGWAQADTIAINLRRYEINLKEVTPFPGAKSTASKKATFTIKPI